MALDMTAAVRINAFVDGIGQIEGLQKSLSRVDKQATGLAGVFQRLGNAGKTVGGVLASIGVGALANTFAKAGIDADRTRKRIANLAGSLNETSSLMKFASEAAKTYGIGQTQAANAVADLYARLRPAGTSLDKIKTAFTGVNNAAAAMNLTADQTDNVMLQLSQALGSGKLQGDEFRSVMEQLPSIGQAIAKVLNTDVASLKTMASEGKITSDVLLQALAKLSQQKPPPPDAYKKFQAALADLQTEIGTKLLPALTPLAQFGSQLIDVFSKLPQPLQNIIIAVGALTAAFVVLGPAISAIISISGALRAVFAGGSIFATIAGYLGAVVPKIMAIGTALKGLLPILFAVFTGPVGWAALLITAGVALYVFRDKVAQVFRGLGILIGAAFNGIRSIFVNAVNAFTSIFVQPIVRLSQSVVQGISNAFKQLGNFITAPFRTALGFVRSVMRDLLTYVASGINRAIGVVNRLIGAYNRLPAPDIPLVPSVSVPAFAEGGTVNKPTLALVGEGGQREYIIPESRMAQASANYLAGSRGNAVLSDRNGAGGGLSIQIQTGPVLQQNGQNWVSVRDMEQALNTLADSLLSNNRTPGGRRYQGVAA